MSHLILPRREIWTRQPQGAVEIDWSNPITRGLISAAFARGYDYVNGSGVLSGTSVNSVTRFGVGRNLSGSISFPKNSTTYSTTLGSVLAISNIPTVDWAIAVNNHGLAIGRNNGSLAILTSYGSYYYPTALTGVAVMMAVANGNNYGAQDGFYIDGNPLSYNSRTTNGTNDSNSMSGGNAVLSARWVRRLSPAEIKSISANPWQIFKPRQSRLFVSLGAGGGSTLNAAAAGQASAAGAASLATQVALAAVGVALADGSATAAVQIPLSATGISVAEGSAQAQATITINAAGLAQAAGQAGLSASVLLQAAGVAQAAGNATLAAQLNALASGAAQASGSANLSGGAPGALTADGAAQAGGSAGLSVTVGLSASGINTAGGGANLSAPAPGALSASGAASAQGGLNPAATVSLTAAGFVQAMAAGVLTLTLPLSAFAPLTMAVSHQRLSRLTTVSQRLSTLLCGVSHG